MPRTSLPQGIADREDRLLAYYINLINQQEQQEAKRRDSTGSVSDETERVEEKPEANERVLEAPKQRPVGRPRKYPAVDVVAKSEKSPSIDGTEVKSENPPENRTDEEANTRATPRKYFGTKALVQAEAERIISTILEKRPGRAEFGDPPKKRKSETSLNEEAPPPSPKRGPGRPKILVETLEPVPVGEEIEPPAVVVKRGPGRPPKHPRPPAVSVVPEPVEIVPAKSRPVGRPPKQPRTQSVEPDEKVNKVIGSPKVSPLKRVPPKSLSKPDMAAAQEPAKEHVFSAERPGGANSWWRKPVSLQVLEYEEDLVNALSNLEQASSDYASDTYSILKEYGDDNLAKRIALLVNKV
jgi:hypothetical protein